MFMLTLPVCAAAQSRGSLRGHIENESGYPLAGATVLLEPDHIRVQCDKDGNFLVKDLFAGVYSIEISSIGHKTWIGKTTVNAGSAATLNVRLSAGSSELDEVSITGSKSNPDNLIRAEFSAMPVTVINRRTIELMGSRRLDEILKEQTGIAIVNDLAGGNRSAGVQVQGFSSEYIMILIDGQPMIGRNSGSLDLSRISVTNIERIEIIKGAASCLFGSEAMGGAINIITRHGVNTPQGLASLRYGSLNMTDASLEAESPFASGNGSFNIGANYYRTDGFNVNTRYQTDGTTLPPYDNYTIQGRARYRINKASTLGATGRYALRKSQMTRAYGTNTYEDHMDEADINASVSLNSIYESGLQALSRYYFTHYRWESEIIYPNGGTADPNTFRQTVHRAEQQFAYNKVYNLNLTGGAGFAVEQMTDHRFGDTEAMKNGFIYLQGDWKAFQAVSITGGARYDQHSNYGGRLNPSIGLSYSPLSWLTLKGALGSGFKTPDFKQRYQMFTNALVGYTVLGADVAREVLNEMQAAGEISELRNYTLNKLQGGLQPERSRTLNLTAVMEPLKSIKIEVSAYRHRISNQINSFQVATATGGRWIYSYINLPVVVNKGVDASLSLRASKDIEISLGYQYLRAKDLSVEDSIRKGSWPYNSLRNNTTGQTTVSRASDYWGIENRSVHMGNLRIFYNFRKPGMGISLRLNYRGKYPFGDANGNYYIDRYDTFVDGYFLVNASVEKKLLHQRLSIQLTGDNLFDYTAQLMPGQPSRVILAGVTYRFYKQTNRH